MILNNKLNHLVGAVGKERFIIDTVINELSIDSLLLNFDKLCISNKTKKAIGYLKLIIQKRDLPSSISGLTEINEKVLINSTEKNLNDILCVLNFPATLEIDARQFEKLRLLREVLELYEVEKSQKGGEQILEM